MAKLKERRNIMHTATDYINILFDKKYCKNIATIIKVPFHAIATTLKR